MSNSWFFITLASPDNAGQVLASPTTDRAHLQALFCDLVPFLAPGVTARLECMGVGETPPTFTTLLEVTK